MSLKFWLGPGGSGKSTKLYNFLIEESIKHPEQNYFIIVPEQANLSTQQELVRLHPRGGILNMDVLSFNRLAHRIFEETGYGADGGRVIDDMGKNLVLRRVSQLHREELPLLGDNLYKLGYITQVKSLISEFMQYGISPERAKLLSEEASNAGKGQLSSKLKDVSLLYSEFLSILKDRYTTREELMVRLSKSLPESEKIKKTVMAFDGFTGFTPVQLEVMTQLLILCPEVHVVLNLDKRGESDDIRIEEHELFYLSKHTISQLGKIADECHVIIKDPEVILDEIPVRFCNNKSDKNLILAHLEKNLFREKSEKMQGIPSEDYNGRISVVKALNAEEELENVCVKIRELVREKDLRYKDIAIITGDIELYRSSIERSLEKHDIPFFTDKTQPVLLNPMIEFLRAAISALADNYTYESVFRLLRSGLTDIPREDVDMFENYCVATGVKGRSGYRRIFSALPAVFRRRDAEVKAEYLLKINDIRACVAGIFDALEGDIMEGQDTGFNAGRKISVRTFSTAFCNMLSRCDVADKLALRSRNLSDAGDVSASKAYEQIYERVMGVFEQMVELLGDEKLTVREFGQLLDAGLDEIRIGIIPQSTDYVQVGDLTRSRVGDIRALFVVGVNDGIVPMGVSSGGLLSDDDKNFFMSNNDDIAFAPTARENAYTQRLYLYMMLTKPREGLYLSYCKINQSGESIRPSYLIRTLTSIFPDLKVRSAVTSIADLVSDKNGSFGLIADNMERYVGLSENDADKEFCEDFEQLISYYGSDEKYGEQLKRLLLSADKEPENVISKAVAAALYGHRIYSSVTRLEKYASCAYAYYLKYGLGLKERETFDFAASDLGTVFHSSLEVYTNKLKDAGLTWENVSEEQMEEMMDEAVDFAVASEDAAALYSTRRSAYMVRRIKRIMNRTARVLKYQAGKGMFSPHSVEVDFNSIENLDALNLKISDEDSIRLFGRIDRIDTCREGDTTYVKVIDYKSGDVSLDIDAVYEGRQLQLVVYMDTALELVKSANGGRSVPAGILYYHIDDPLIKDGEGQDIAGIEAEIRKKLKLTGYVNSDRHIIDLMDDDFDKKSDVIPVGFKKDGELYADSKVLSTEEFEELSRAAREAMTKIGAKMLDGDIYTARETGEAIKHPRDCEYCEFGSVCKQRTSVIFNGTDDSDFDGTGNASSSDGYDF